MKLVYGVWFLNSLQILPTVSISMTTRNFFQNSNRFPNISLCSKRKSEMKTIHYSTEGIERINILANDCYLVHVYYYYSHRKRYVFFDLNTPSFGQVSCSSKFKKCISIFAIKQLFLLVVTFMISWNPQTHIFIS